jgi:carbamoyl-phosphate synthase large subunit
MKSTGEVMGIDESFALAFAKAQIAAGTLLPFEGSVFVSVLDADKPAVVPIARSLAASGFRLIATAGTADHLEKHGLVVERVNKVREGSPHSVDRLIAGEIAMVINTPEGASSYADSFSIRRSALERHVPYFTTIAGAEAAAEAIEQLKKGRLGVRALQDYHRT